MFAQTTERGGLAVTCRSRSKLYIVNLAGRTCPIATMRPFVLFVSRIDRRGLFRFGCVRRSDAVLTWLDRPTARNESTAWEPCSKNSKNKHIF